MNAFSKMTREEKINALTSQINHEVDIEILESSRHADRNARVIIEDFSENVLSSFHLPFSIAPNFSINGQVYHVPMVTEESSVVAAASSASKFWFTRGGFQCNIISTVKKGQVHFLWNGEREKLFNHWTDMRTVVNEGLETITSNMQKRGGGILDIKLLDFTHCLDNYFQIDVSFKTVDAMGANFINSCLEKISAIFSEYMISRDEQFEIIISILSNYTPGCLVECKLECSHTELDNVDGETPYVDFIKKFENAIQISQIDTGRAVTHNKGIMNGIDAVAIATGNDFRAIEAGAHAYAAKTGYYRGLTEFTALNNVFSYSLRVPLALGTVGGVTSLHPQAKLSMRLLNNPNAKDLMAIMASVGLANNFSAIKSLITKGIQHGHMKMHLKNILNKHKATGEEKRLAEKHFKGKTLSYNDVKQFIDSIR